MTPQSTNLLTKDEYHALYAAPSPSQVSTATLLLSKQEEVVLRCFRRLDLAVYYAISLAFFKIKQSFVKFSYRDVTAERQFIMQHYFPNQPVPRSFPSEQNTIVRIENKVLSALGFKRFSGEAAKGIIKQLKAQAAQYPRQRQLVKALLALTAQKKIVRPPFTTLQKCITEIWNCEMARVTRAYYRYTGKKQRDLLLAQLNKADHAYPIINIRKDMKKFATQHINIELEKHQQLQAIFCIAKEVLPKLQLPPATIEYYAELINYYSSHRLKQLSQDTTQLYLLCYSYSRFQYVNDNLLQAFKKRTLQFVNDATEAGKSAATNTADTISAIRQNIHDLLMTIKNDNHPETILKSKLFRCIPESELETTASLLLHGELDKNALFWQMIEKKAQSISLNLRPIFLALDITIVRNESLKEIVQRMKGILGESTTDMIQPDDVIYLNKQQSHYIIQDDGVNMRRFEFLLYKTLAHHIDTNKLILRYSVKHKEVEDTLISLPKWEKIKNKMLKQLPYITLRQSPQTVLDEKKEMLKQLYQAVNADINQGKNPDLIIKNDQNGKSIWRITPLEQAAEPNERFFSHFPKRSIIDVFQFVENKTHFLNALESILPRATKNKTQKNHVVAVILANALRMGSQAMADASNLNSSALRTTEKNYIRMDTLNQMTTIINTCAEKLPIFQQYNLDGKYHASLDGMKVGTRLNHTLARYSPKFLGLEPGVSVYNAILNHFPLTSRLISSNEYEGNFMFEMLHHQNMDSFRIDRASTDKHGKNSMTFALSDLTDLDYAPRIPKPHNELLWGVGRHEEYEGLIIHPDKMIPTNTILNNWDDMQRTVTSMLTGESMPNVTIGKMASAKYTSKTKLAFSHYNNLIKSIFILRYIRDKSFRRMIECALNRGEAYHHLYRSITLLNGGKFRGQSESEMMIWEQCSRLTAAIILYYNAHILNHLYLTAKTDDERDFLLHLSPGAWVHINLLGHYLFSDQDNSLSIDKWLANWNWQAEFPNG